MFIADKDKYLQELLKTIIDIRYVGDSAGLKTFKNPVFTISDLHFAHFSDMSMGHKIKITIIIKNLLDLSIGY